MKNAVKSYEVITADGRIVFEVRLISTGEVLAEFDSIFLAKRMVHTINSNVAR